MCLGGVKGMPIVLRDGNGAFYPLVKHCLDGIRTPAWLTLPPMSCLHVKTRVLSNSLATVKPKISLLAVVFRVSVDVYIYIRYSY
jgi:hypothetical protein